MGYEAKKTEHCGAKHGKGVLGLQVGSQKGIESNPAWKAKREIRDGVIGAESALQRRK